MDVRYEYISMQSPYYHKCVALRYKAFFSGLPLDIVHDDEEEESEHLVAIYNDEVAGYIRLFFRDNGARISQFVVDDAMRGKYNIAHTLIRMTMDKAKEYKCDYLWGEIRLHMKRAAAAYGFTVSDEPFPSKRTGIPHLLIHMTLESDHSQDV